MIDVLLFSKVISNSFSNPLIYHLIGTFFSTSYLTFFSAAYMRKLQNNSLNALYSMYFYIQSGPSVSSQILHPATSLNKESKCFSTRGDEEFDHYQTGKKLLKIPLMIMNIVLTAKRSKHSFINTQQPA